MFCTTHKFAFMHFDWLFRCFSMHGRLPFGRTCISTRMQHSLLTRVFVPLVIVCQMAFGCTPVQVVFLPVHRRFVAVFVVRSAAVFSRPQPYVRSAALGLAAAVLIAYIRRVTHFSTHVVGAGGREKLSSHVVCRRSLRVSFSPKRHTFIAICGSQRGRTLR